MWNSNDNLQVEFNVDTNKGEHNLENWNIPKSWTRLATKKKMTRGAGFRKGKCFKKI